MQCAYSTKQAIVCEALQGSIKDGGGQHLGPSGNTPITFPLH